MDGITNSFTSMTQGLAFAYKAMFGASSDQRLIDGFRDGTRGAPNHPFITNPYAPPYQNPESLDSYGRETGVMREEYQRFYASEPSLQSAIDGKVAAIASLDVSVLPQDEKSEADKRVAEFVREAVKNCPGGWSGLISNILMPSFVNGFSVTEKWLGGIDSEPCFDRLRPKYSGLWSIRRLAQIDTNYIKFQLDNTKQVIGVINTKLGLIGYSPDRVMIYSHRSIFENPYGRSDIRAAYRSCQLIENAYKLWYIALKNYSAPFMKVKTKATGASFNKLKDALAAARAGGWITLSQDDDADLLNFASATSWQAFERKVIMARQEIYLAIRGSYLPFLEGGEQDARGDTQVHKVSSDAIEALIVNSVCEVINHQLVPDLVRPNFGDRVGLPSVSLGGTNWNETKAQLEVVKTVEKELGRPVSTAFIYKVSQMEPPRDETDGPPPAPAPIQPQGPQSGGFPFHEQLVNKFAEWLGSQAKDRGASKFSDVTSYQYADAFIENADGKVLILKRNTNDDFQPGAWCLPGGKIEPGESPLQAIQREVKEETGLAGIEFKQFAAYFNQDGSTSYAFSGSVSGLDPVVLDPDEHTEHEWLADTRKGYPRIRFMLSTKDRIDDYFNGQSKPKTFAINLEDEPAAPSPQAKIAIAGPDGQAAIHLTKAAMDEGRAVLESITYDAIKRKLNGELGPLFNKEEIGQLSDALASAMGTAELLGRYRIRERALKGDGTRRFAALDPVDGPPRVKPLPPVEALKFFRELMPSLDDDPTFDQRQRRISFTWAQRASQVILEQVKGAINTAIAHGESGTAVIQEIMDEAGVSSRNPQYADMVFRTNAIDAYNVGADDERQHEDVRDEFPAWQYLGINDGRQGADHAPHFGKYYPASATFNAVRGDRPFNCRCSQRAIGKREWERLVAGGAKFEDGF